MNTTFITNAIAVLFQLVKIPLALFFGFIVGAFISFAPYFALASTYLAICSRRGHWTTLEDKIARSIELYQGQYYLEDGLKCPEEMSVLLDLQQVQSMFNAAPDHWRLTANSISYSMDGTTYRIRLSNQDNVRYQQWYKKKSDRIERMQRKSASRNLLAQVRADAEAR